jgi:hypothetical protein
MKWKPPLPPKPSAKDSAPATEPQKRVLYRILYADQVHLIPTMTKEEAYRIISASVAKAAAKNGTLRPSERQEYFLRARGRWRNGMSRSEATYLIGLIKREEEIDKRRSAGSWQESPDSSVASPDNST